MPLAGNKANTKVMIVGHSMITHICENHFHITFITFTTEKIKCGLK
jgi:hypothetical protein